MPRSRAKDQAHWPQIGSCRGARSHRHPVQIGHPQGLGPTCNVKSLGHKKTWMVDDARWWPVMVKMMMVYDS
jgi:hypothetical protein